MLAIQQKVPTGLIVLLCSGYSNPIFAFSIGGTYVYIIDQAQGQDGGILAEFSFCIFTYWDEVEVHKNAKRERGYYPAILTELAWSIKDLLYGIKSTEKNDLRTYFPALKRKPVTCLSDGTCPYILIG